MVKQASKGDGGNRLYKELPSGGGTVLPSTGEFVGRLTFEKQIRDFRDRLEYLRRKREQRRSAQ